MLLLYTRTHCPALNSLLLLLAAAAAAAEKTVLLLEVSADCVSTDSGPGTVLQTCHRSPPQFSNHPLVCFIDLKNLTFSRSQNERGTITDLS